MSRFKFIYWVNIGLIITFLITAVTGVLKVTPVMRLLSGIRLNYLHITLWHDWGGFAMIIFTLLHIILYWKSLKIMSKQMFKKK